MPERKGNPGLVVLCILVFLQIFCFLLNALDNMLAMLRMTFVGYKGAALVRPVVDLQKIARVGSLFTWFYIVCCVIFFLLLLGMAMRRPFFFRALLVLDVISLFLGLYGYYFWLTGGAHPTLAEQVITLTEPFLSSGGLLLLLCLPDVRRLWLPRRL